MAICTPADVRTYLGLTEAQAPDSVLQPLCDAADAFVLSYLNMDTLDPTDYVETYHGTGSNTFVPDHRPIITVTAVAVDGQTVAAAVAQGAGFVWDKLAIYMRQSLFTRGIKNITLNYRAGYSPIPKDIIRAAIDIVAEKYMRRNRVGVSSKTIGQESISYSRDDVTPFAQKALRQYRLTMVTTR